MLKNSIVVPKIYHAHVYFDPTTLQKATNLRQEIRALFNIEMGRLHKKLVGPHPAWSYQIKFKKNLFSEFIPWLMTNRRGLTVFIHACTGENLKDHTENVCWLGCSRKLNLAIFNIKD